MSEATRTMLLYCDVANSHFVLTAEGANWGRSFDTFERAFEEAEARTMETVPIIMYTGDGRKIMETTVSPAPPELVQFSHPLMGRRHPAP